MHAFPRQAGQAVKKTRRARKQRKGRRPNGISEMKLKTLLAKHKSALISRWVDAIVETYPPETAKFLKNKKDQFHNPVGHTIVAETQNLFDQVLEGVDREKVTPFLDRIIRIRAIQEFHRPKPFLSFFH